MKILPKYKEYRGYYPTTAVGKFWYNATACYVDCRAFGLGVPKSLWYASQSSWRYIEDAAIHYHTGSC